MQVCANCGHTNRPGVLFCENCGTSLTGKAAVGTTKSFEEGSAYSTGPLAAAGTDYFMPNATLRVEIEGGPEPILIKPKQELIFGRRDPATGAMPDIDLTPYAGYRMGVSRRHAAIRSADDSHLDIWDLGSSNGTFLNGQRLNAHRPYRLRDGDRLRLGQMIIRIFFQPPDETAINATGEHAVADTPGPEVEEAPAVEKALPSLAEILSETGHSEPIDPAKAARAAQPASGPATLPPHVEPEVLPEMSSTASLGAPSEEDKQAAAAMFAEDAEAPAEESPAEEAPTTYFPVDEAPSEQTPSEQTPSDEEAASEEAPPDEPAS